MSEYLQINDDVTGWFNFTELQTKLQHTKSLLRVASDLGYTLEEFRQFYLENFDESGWDALIVSKMLEDKVIQTRTNGLKVWYKYI